MIHESGLLLELQLSPVLKRIFIVKLSGKSIISKSSNHDVQVSSFRENDVVEIICLLEYSDLQVVFKC